MHAIIFCDTNDKRIGQAMQIDHDNMIRELGNYACFIDYDYLVYDNTGECCSKTHLLSTLADIEIEPQDIVVFFYSGHGTRAMNNESDPLPQMCLGSTFDSEFVPLQYAINALSKHHPKLIVSITNCCNAENPSVSIKPLLSQASGPTSLSEVNAEAYKKLFSETSGQAIITSSRAGELTWCSPTVGGLFVCDFLDIMYLVGQNEIQADWESVFQNAKEKTSARNILTDRAPYIATQMPYYTINTKSEAKAHEDKGRDDNANDGDKGEDKKDDVVIEKKTEPDLLAVSLNDLVDPSFTADERLNMIPVIIKKHFSPNAKVRTLGRNGMTVDYEPASDFLRRVALSKRIAKITVVNRDSNEKHSAISVHEIHI